MAILTDMEKVLLRNTAERKAADLNIPVRWMKSDLNNVYQAIEDVLDGAAFKTVISDAINAASGISFTISEKKWLFAFAMLIKYSRDK